MRKRPFAAMFAFVAAVPFAAAAQTARVAAPDPAIMTLPTTITVPAVASIHGQNGTYFHSAVWVMNRSYSNSIVVGARYRCFAGQSCAAPVWGLQLAPRQSLTYGDVVSELFNAPETAGALELEYDAAVATVVVTSRVYTPALPNPTYGASVVPMTQAEARTRTLFLGLEATGSDLHSGFRCNAGAYNPNAASTSVTFTIYNGATGLVLGHPVTRTWGPNEAYQINDIITAAGYLSGTTPNVYLDVDSTLPIFPYVTKIDNQSGDSVWILPSAEEPE